MSTSAEELRARYTAYLIEVGAFDEVSERPTPASEIVYRADTGVYLWAEPIDPECKVARAAMHMFHVDGRGWFVGTGGIFGRVPADAVDAAHDEALLLDNPVGMSIAERSAYESIRNAGSGGLQTDYQGPAKRSLLARGVIRRRGDRYVLNLAPDGR